MASSHPPGIQLTSACSFAGLRFEEVRYDAGVRHPVHSHESVFLDLCLEGTIQEIWGKRTFVRGASTLNFFPAGAPHSDCYKERTRTFQIVLTPPRLNRIQEYCSLVEILTTYDNDAPTWLAMRLYREFQHRDSVSSLMLEGLLLELLAEMARQSIPQSETGCPRWLRQVEEYLRAHFTENLSLETIAATVDIHPSHLMRSFRQQHHCTIGEYVRRLRVEYACHLLTTSEETAAQIAVSTGFADQSHFNRTFKGLTGMTPTEFQKVRGRATLRQPMSV